MTDFHPPWAEVRDVVARALKEDLGPLGDITAALLPFDAVAHGALVARQPGVLAGRRCAQEAFTQLDSSISLEWFCDDGDQVEPGTRLARLDGPLRPALTAERTALNLLCRLSGIATLTRHYVEAVGAAPTRILDTRKTTPGLRALEKAAVRAGGGANHRASLSEMVLIKDNHLAGTTIADVVAEAHRRWPMRTVEVECDRLDQVRHAVDAGADVVMLDNMDVGDVARCVAEIAGRAIVEVSGGVRLDTVGAYATAGADVISVGALTMSAPALDIGLDLDGDSPCS